MVPSKQNGPVRNRTFHRLPVYCGGELLPSLLFPHHVPTVRMLILNFFFSFPTFLLLLDNIHIIVKI